MLLIAAPLAAQPAAPDPATLPHRVSFVETGDATLDEPLAETSRLRRLAEESPVDALGLIARAEAEPAVLEQVLRSQGYWAGQIEVRIAGEPAAAPGLAGRLSAAGGEVAVEIRAIPGPRYRLRDITTRPATPDEAAAVAALGAPPGLAPDDPASAAAVLDAEVALLAGLRRAGHPLALVSAREVLVDHDAQAMDVRWTLAPGPRSAFARPEITGDTQVNPAFLARMTRRMEGQIYDPMAIERTRRALLNLGVFDVVRARAGARLDADGRLPVTFAVTDRPRNAAGVNLAYETNFGPSFRVFYERRNVFGNAERLRFEAEGSRLSADRTDGNARFSASFRRPGLIDGTTSLLLDATVLRERLRAYDRDAVVVSALLERPFGDQWVLRGGPVVDYGRVGRDGKLESSELVGLVLGVRFDTTDSVLDPRRGLRASMTVVPYAGFEGGGGFIRTLGTASVYFDVFGTGGTVVALRGTLGSITGTDRNIPRDKRFYAGGGGSVRGYTFQSVGPRDSSNRPDGGQSLAEGSIELRQRVRGSFGMVAFLDAGTVGTATTPDTSDVRMGAGLGLRYATGIGPLRLDVAIPLQQRQGEASYALYVGLGQSF